MTPALLFITSFGSIFFMALPAVHDGFQGLGAKPNLALIVCLWAAVRLPPAWAMTLPLATGMVLDMLSSAPTGTYTFLFLVTCLPFFSLKGILDFTHLPVFLLSVLVGALLKCSLESVLVSQVLGSRQALVFARSSAILEVIGTTLLAAPMFAAFRLRFWMFRR